MLAFPKPISKKEGRTVWGSTLRVKTPLKAGSGFKARSSMTKCAPKNPFTTKTRELFQGAPCWYCNEAQPDCGHHTLGRVSASPYNFSPMHNESCHINRDGKMGGHAYHMKKEQQAKNLQMTKYWLDSIGYQPTKKDQEFLIKYADFYK